MELENRLAALEKHVNALDEKRRQLRNQFVALQLLLIRLLPVISTSSTAEVERAMEAAATSAGDVLLALQYDEEDIVDVLEAMECLRSDILSDPVHSGHASCH